MILEKSGSEFREYYKLSVVNYVIVSVSEIWSSKKRFCMIFEMKECCYVVCFLPLTLYVSLLFGTVSSNINYCLVFVFPFCLKEVSINATICDTLHTSKIDNSFDWSLLHSRCVLLVAWQE